MPDVLLDSSPLLPDTTPVNIFYRELGAGPPLLFLHGGWGYEMYSFRRQIAELSKTYRCLAPDRSGYGRSTHLTSDLSPTFHYHAAAETLKFMDALSIDQAFFWGHSDGAVIAAILGFTAPDRVKGLILEAFHFHAQKLGSRAFFEIAAENPEGMGPELSARFAREHGDEYWRQLITSHAQAWLDLGLNSDVDLYNDLYEGKLGQVVAPTLLLHGRLDPRTEAGEIEAVQKQLPAAKIVYLEQGTHSPHSETLTADLTTRIAADELDLWLDKNG